MTFLSDLFLRCWSGRGPNQLGRRAVARQTVRQCYCQPAGWRQQACFCLATRVRRGGAWSQQCCGLCWQVSLTQHLLTKITSTITRLHHDNKNVIRNFLFLGFQPLAPGHEFHPSNPNVVCFLYTIWTGTVIISTTNNRYLREIPKMRKYKKKLKEKIQKKFKTLIN